MAQQTNIDAPPAKSAAYYSNQAALALEYAMARPPSDLKGFIAALRDAEQYRKLAIVCRAGAA